MDEKKSLIQRSDDRHCRNVVQAKKRGHTTCSGLRGSCDRGSADNCRRASQCDDEQDLRIRRPCGLCER